MQQLAQNEMKANCRMPVWVRSNEGLGGAASRGRVVKRKLLTCDGLLF